MLYRRIANLNMEDTAYIDIEKLRDTIIKTGICRYGFHQYKVFLCTSNLFPGTGDYEDDADLRDDQKIDCFCIWFEDLTTTNHICAGGGYYKSLCEAVNATENSGGFVKWLDSIK